MGIEISHVKVRRHKFPIFRISLRWLFVTAHRILTSARNIVSKAFGGHAYYAEFSSDRMVRQQFFPDFSYKGVIVEVGCATPRLISFSQHFRETGWRCIGVEPNPEFVRLHEKEGNEIYQFAAADFEADNVPFFVIEDSSHYGDETLSAHSFSALSIREDFAQYRGGLVHNLKKREILVSVRTLNTILEQVTPPLDRPVDLLTIDVEGYELDVMRGFSPKKFGVKVIVLENLFHKPDYVDYMRTQGYTLWKKIKYNYIFIEAEGFSLSRTSDAKSL